MQSFYQKITSIFNKWIWKASDYDWNKSIQCVDWARQFANEIGSPIWTFWGSAINCWNSWWAFIWTEWKRVKYEKNIPTAWDIIFFNKTPSNQYWHVAVVDWNCSDSVLNTVEQNWWKWQWKWQWTDAIRRKSWTYKNCLGWFTLVK